MARGDKTKRRAFEVWVRGKSLEDIQYEAIRGSTTLPASVRGWVLDWERGKQRTWNPKIKNSN